MIKLCKCRICGGTDIGVKDIIVQTNNKTLIRKCWAYCRACNNKTREFLMEEDNSDKEIEIAFRIWNSEN